MSIVGRDGCGDVRHGAAAQHSKAARGVALIFDGKLPRLGFLDAGDAQALSQEHCEAAKQNNRDQRQQGPWPRGTAFVRICSHAIRAGV